MRYQMLAMQCNGMRLQQTLQEVRCLAELISVTPSCCDASIHVSP